MTAQLSKPINKVSHSMRQECRETQLEESANGRIKSLISKSHNLSGAGLRSSRHHICYWSMASPSAKTPNLRNTNRQLPGVLLIKLSMQVHSDHWSLPRRLTPRRPRLRPGICVCIGIDVWILRVSPPILLQILELEPTPTRLLHICV